jgi:hypothetical protein
MSTQKQIEANRRNAQKSTGPRTKEGKERSRFNAVTHGLTGKLDVLPDEDAGSLQERIDDWTDDWKPRCALERELIEKAARISWRLKRAEQVQVERLTANILAATSGVNEALDDEVLTLGTELFQDLTRPHGYSPGVVVDPNCPARLVFRLESSAPGCSWLLDRWAELRTMLEQDRPWESSDKLKAIRLLGRYPIDALDDCRVAGILMGCHAIDSDCGVCFAEIANRLNPDELSIVKQRLAGREREWERPRGQVEVRRALIQLVEHAVNRLETQAEAHRRRAEREIATAPDRLAFDDSPEGERLRGYESKCHGALIRTIETLFQVRKFRKSDPADSANALSTNPTSVGNRKNSQNEPNSGSRDIGAPPAKRRIAQNEPNSECDGPAYDGQSLVRRGVLQIEPNSASGISTSKDARLPVESPMSQNEPNFAYTGTTESYSIWSNGRITQNEPNSVHAGTTENRSIWSDGGITQNEPNFVYLCHMKDMTEAELPAAVLPGTRRRACSHDGSDQGRVRGRGRIRPRRHRRSSGAPRRRSRRDGPRLLYRLRRPRASTAVIHPRTATARVAA